MWNRNYWKEIVNVNKYKYWKYNSMLINYKKVNKNREIADLMAAVHTDIITTKRLVFRWNNIVFQGKVQNKRYFSSRKRLTLINRRFWLPKKISIWGRNKHTQCLGYGKFSWMLCSKPHFYYVLDICLNLIPVCVPWRKHLQCVVGGYYKKLFHI